VVTVYSPVTVKEDIVGVVGIVQSGRSLGIRVVPKVNRPIGVSGINIPEEITGQFSVWILRHVVQRLCLTRSGPQIQSPIVVE